MQSWVVFVIIGLFGGFAAGLFGIGGGVVIVVALVQYAGFSQHLATGTTLMMLLPPLGLAGALEFYRHGNVDVRAALILAAPMFVGSWFGACVACRMQGPHLRLLFGLFVCAIGANLVYGACKRLGWF